MRFLVKNLTIGISTVLLVGSCAKEPADRNPVLMIPPVQMVHVTDVIQFGEDLGAGKENPAFEYILFNELQMVLAVEEGIVEAVVENPGFNDYEIRIRLNSNWIIIYDHVIDLAVSEGEDIEPGQLLGAVGEGNRFELQLVHKSGTSYCPFSYASEAFINAHQDIADTWCVKDTVADD